MTSRILLVTYAVVGVLNVTLTLVDAPLAYTLSKALLMPLLLAWLLTFAHGHLTAPLRWLAAGLVCAWAGDLLLEGDGDLLFILGLLAFLAMQVSYIVAFTRVPGPGLVRAWKIALVPYVAVWLVLNLMLSPGALRIPVLIYSVVLVAMAVTALDLVIRIPQDKGWRVAIGAGLFLFSDALIALRSFGPLESSGALSAVVMATYIVAQAMIVTGFTQGVMEKTATR